MLKRTTGPSLLAVLTLIASLQPTSAHAQQGEVLGREAEQAGKFREALKYYQAALQSSVEGSSADQRLREKIIALVQKVSPPPAIPDEARRFAVRGQIAVKEAKSQADYVDAAREFNRALRLAPWWAESYFNLAVAQEKAGQFTEAVRSLKLYLLAAPKAPDADKIKDQIYALEYRQERARKEEQERAEETRRREQARRDAEEQERRRQEQARREAEERQRRVEQEKREEAQLVQSLSGTWRNGCSNNRPVQVRYIREGVLDFRYWNNIDNEWGPWVGERYGSYIRWSPGTRSLIYHDSQGYKTVYKIISSDYLVGHTDYGASSQTCEWRRQ